MPIPFVERLVEKKLTRRSLKTLQINIGKLCNLSCRHCHVGSGPNKVRENMKEEVAQRMMQLIRESKTIQTVDFTGGAPELNPYFRTLVEYSHKLKKSVMVRCNLTVLFESGQEDTIEFFKKNKVHVVASLPCYSADNVHKQRGDGVFSKSIEALQSLNKVGYGVEGGLQLDLVYNPVGATLPPDQKELSIAYKQKLKDDFGIVFNQLFTITNMPIKRFLVDLKKQGKESEYMELLAANFNNAAAEQVMCRDMISVSWDGQIYDCDFNQALDIPAGYTSKTIFDIESFDEYLGDEIALANHCYGCTAGSGSSCGGALT